MKYLHIVVALLFLPALVNGQIYSKRNLNFTVQNRTEIVNKYYETGSEIMVISEGTRMMVYDTMPTTFNSGSADGIAIMQTNNGKFIHTQPRANGSYNVRDFDIQGDGTNENSKFDILFDFIRHQSENRWIHAPAGDYYTGGGFGTEIVGATDFRLTGDGMHLSKFRIDQGSTQILDFTNFSNLIFEDVGFVTSSSENFSRILDIQGANNVYINRCYFANTNKAAGQFSQMQWKGVDTLTVTNSQFYRAQGKVAGNGGGAASKILFEHNRWESTADFAVSVVSKDSSETIGQFQFLYNEIDTVEGSGVVFLGRDGGGSTAPDSTTRIQIIGNIVHHVVASPNDRMFNLSGLGKKAYDITIAHNQIDASFSPHQLEAIVIGADTILNLRLEDNDIRGFGGTTATITFDYGDNISFMRNMFYDTREIDISIGSYANNFNIGNIQNNAIGYRVTIDTGAVVTNMQFLYDIIGPVAEIFKNPLSLLADTLSTAEVNIIGAQWTSTDSDQVDLENGTGNLTINGYGNNYNVLNDRYENIGPNTTINDYWGFGLDEFTVYTPARFTDFSYFDADVDINATLEVADIQFPGANGDIFGNPHLTFRRSSTDSKGIRFAPNTGDIYGISQGISLGGATVNAVEILRFAQANTLTVNEDLSLGTQYGSGVLEAADLTKTEAAAVFAATDGTLLDKMVASGTETLAAGNTVTITHNLGLSTGTELDLKLTPLSNIGSWYVSSTTANTCTITFTVAATGTETINWMAWKK